MSEINFDLSSNINNMNGENPQVLSSSSDPHNPFINLKDVIGQQPAGLRGGGVDGLDAHKLFDRILERNEVLGMQFQRMNVRLIHMWAPLCHVK